MELEPEPVAAEPVQEEAPTLEVAEPKPYEASDFYEDDKPNADAAEGDAEPEGEAQEVDPEPIDAPVSWAKDAKEVFGQLPREAQEIIATREKDREAAVQAKFREAAGTRQQVETEARTALQTIMQNHAQQLAQYNAMFEVPAPNLALLNSDDPSQRALYFQQEAQYRYATAQREQLAQQMSEAEQHASAVATHQQQAELQAEHQLLEEKLGTDWSDPSKRAELLGNLTPTAAELGYPQELIAQARACDILAMKTAFEWKAKADKFDALNKAKMIPVRAAKGAIPPTARPSAPNGQRAPVSVVDQLYPNDVRRN